MVRLDLPGQELDGFLIGHEDTQWRWIRDLFPETVELGEGVRPRQLDRIDGPMMQWAERALAREPRWDSHPWAPPRVSPTLEVLLVAYRAEQRGRNDLARSIAGRAPWTCEQVAADLERAYSWGAIASFADPTVSTDRLRARLQRSLDVFPASPHAAELTSLRDELEQAATRADGPSATEAERLVRELADHTSSATHGLVALGLAAVPALLGLEGSRRPTREVASIGGGLYGGYLSNPFPRVVRADEKALEILSSIARRWLPSWSEARDWWNLVQRRGEYAVLLEQERRPDGVVAFPNRGHGRLLQLDRARALQDLIRLARSHTWEVRASAIPTLAFEAGSAQVPVLLEAARADPDPELRAQAIAGLAERAHPEWESIALRHLRRVWGSGEGADSVMRLLIERGGPGIAERFDRLPRIRSVDRALQLVSTFRTTPPEAWMRTRRLGEAVAMALGDDERRWGSYSFSSEGGPCPAPSPSDLAAQQLGTWFSLPYRCQAPPFVTARRKRDLENRFREVRGEPGLPVPAPPPEPPGSPDGRPVLVQLDLEMPDDAASIAQPLRDAVGSAVRADQITSVLLALLAWRADVELELRLYREASPRRLWLRLAAKRGIALPPGQSPATWSICSAWIGPTVVCAEQEGGPEIDVAEVREALERVVEPTSDDAGALIGLVRRRTSP